jgi:hypothetical protein
MLRHFKVVSWQNFASFCGTTQSRSVSKLRNVVAIFLLARLFICKTRDFRTFDGRNMKSQKRASNLRRKKKLHKQKGRKLCWYRNCHKALKAVSYVF